MIESIILMSVIFTMIVYDVFFQYVTSIFKSSSFEFDWFVLSTIDNIGNDSSSNSPSFSFILVRVSLFSNRTKCSVIIRKKMSYRRNSNGTRSHSVGRQKAPRPYATDSHLDLATKNDLLPNILPEVCFEHQFNLSR